MASVVIPEAKLPRLIRFLGGEWRYGRDYYRMKWGEFGFKRGVALALCMFDEHFSFHIHMLRVNAYVTLPFLRRWLREPRDGCMEQWGFTYWPESGGSSLHLNWGDHTKIITMPWCDWVHVSHDVRRTDGSWVPYVPDYRPELQPDGRELLTAPYRYVLESGEIQEVTATYYVERSQRRLRWLRWMEPFSRISHGITIEFSGEVGERAGSWKGGCIGCSYSLRENETPEECLRRMERERKFG